MWYIMWPQSHASLLSIRSQSKDKSKRKMKERKDKNERIWEKYWVQGLQFWQDGQIERINQELE